MAAIGTYTSTQQFVPSDFGYGISQTNLTSAQALTGTPTALAGTAQTSLGAGDFAVMGFFSFKSEDRAANTTIDNIFVGRIYLGTTQQAQAVVNNQNLNDAVQQYTSCIITTIIFGATAGASFHLRADYTSTTGGTCGAATQIIWQLR